MYISDAPGCGCEYVLVSRASAASNVIERLRAGWPPSFVVAQFPNTPLLIAMAAYIAGALTSGWVGAISRAVFYVALGTWAYWEVSDGANWFRRLLGMVIIVYVVVQITRGLHAA